MYTEGVDSLSCEPQIMTSVTLITCLHKNVFDFPSHSAKPANTGRDPSKKVQSILSLAAIITFVIFSGTRARS